MIRLVGVEITRLHWRRAVLLLLVAAVVVPVVIGAATVWNTRPPSPAEQAELEQTLERERERPRMQKQLQRCLDRPGEWGLDPEVDDVEAMCAEFVLPQPEWFGHRAQLDLVQEREEGSGLAVVVVLGILMLLMGTTFVGHDWNSGSMSNQLLFEPRRLRLWLAKALAVTGTALLLSLAVVSAYWLVLDVVVRSRDQSVPDGVLLDGLQQGWRGAAVAAAVALGGYALTMLFRSTVATLGVLFAVSVAGGMLIGALGTDGTERWQPQNNLAAVVMDGVEVWVQVPEECYGPRAPRGEDCDETRVITAAQGTGYLGVLLVGVCGVSALSFRRRDVP